MNTMSKFCAVLMAAVWLGTPSRAEEFPFQKPWAAEGASKNIYLAPPASADAPVKAVRARVVDFGHDFGTWIASPHFRGSPDNPKGNGQDKSEPFEVDGNPATRDTVQYFPFSLTVPFSSRDVSYDDEHINANFYGGAALFFANRDSGGITERFINPDHCADGHFPRDNWALHMYSFKKESPWNAAATWLWLKKDFVNGGDQHRVSFDAESTIWFREARYWNGYTGVRMVVRNGEQFFVSEKTFEGCDLYVLKPQETRWAPWNPQAPFAIVFDEKTAEFKEQVFDDVTACGVYLFKSTMTPDVGAFKFYAFEADATVHRPVRPSETLAMAKIGDLYVSKTEIPYAFWKKIYKWANNNNYAQFEKSGYLFEENGDIGSMETGESREYSPDEPVTGITLHDAAAWCNALSEYEAKTPCYYTDPECTKIFRWVRQSSMWENPVNFPVLYVKWEADGYRLPTPAEWLSAFDKAAPPGKSGGTRPVGLGSPDANGLYDMAGNVREMTWDEEILNLAAKKQFVFCGGSFIGDTDPLKVAASPWGDSLNRGQFDAGLRIVRREAGGSKPAFVSRAADPSPVWIASADDVRAGPGAKKSPKGIVPMVGIPEGVFDAGDGKERVETRITAFELGKTEVTYAQWLMVRQWAEANGYEFNNDGDMGNMEWKSNPAAHTPDEPVANISHRDAMAWCNALSEIEGLTPVYYADEKMTAVYRQANRYKPLMYDEWMEAGNFSGQIAANARQAGGAYIKWAADGYRLPTVAEQSYAFGAGTRKPAADDASAWRYGNANGKTQPAGIKEPNAFGLYDTAGNVMEWAGDRGPVYSPFNPVNPVAYPQPCTDSGGTGGMPVRGGSVHQQHESYFEWKPGGSHGGINADLAYPDTGLRVARHPQSLELDADGKRYKLEGAKPEDVLLFTGTKVVVDGDIQGDVIRVKSIHEVKGNIPDGKISGIVRATGYPPGAVIEDNRPQMDLTGKELDLLQGRTYRANLHRTGVHETEPLRTLSGVKWTFKTGGPVHSSPIAVDGRVFVASDDGWLYAIDAAAGTEVWKYKVANRVEPFWAVPTVAGGTVYINNHQGTVYALDAQSGALKWSRAVSSGTADSLAAAYGALFLTDTPGQAYGLDMETGEVIWKARRRDRGMYQRSGTVTAAVKDGALIFFSDYDGYFAVDISSGRFLWRGDSAFNGKTSSPGAISDGFLYKTIFTAGGLDRIQLPAGELSKMNNPLWTVPAFDGQKRMGGGGVSGYEMRGACAVHNGMAYAACADGNLYAFDLNSKKKAWVFAAGEPLESSVSMAGDVLYFGGQNGTVFAVDTDGNLLWKHATGGAVQSSPWIENRILYVTAQDGTVTALE